MKRFVQIVSAIFLVSFISVSALGADAYIQTTFTANPVLAYPGSSGYIQLNLKSTGTSAANGVKVSVLSADQGITLNNYGVNDLGGMYVGDTTSLIYKFSVPGTTSPGLYTVNFQINYCQESLCKVVNQFAIVSVQSKQSLQLTSIKPNRLDIGSNSTLVFTLANAGGSDLTNVIFNWQDPTGLILPLGSGSRIILPDIGPNQQIDIPVQVVTSPTISPGSHSISVTTDYFDSTGAEQNSTSVAGIIVGGGTSFAVNMQDFSMGSLSLLVANIGVNPATSVSINIPDQQKFHVIGSQNSFLGNLNPGDSTSASFNVIPSENTTNDLHAVLSYTDISGFRQSVDEYVPVKMSFGLQGLQRNRNQSNSNDLFYPGIGVVVLLLAYFIFRRTRKKHAK